ncbi:uracil-DNA glycosylase family protein [Serpentinicella sp. ANB-PHB4]|uniref:uracil-DNA glycosylase family protein n=1 Tax=Serpentinicella sp. ANB-PHB4 TaxID=3074076 RepID=UPI0028645A56|nr:uracil-DNA glycosylase family protein [Serpentinicella sp. ANB-PHB4]MDR5659471.1 uracil-DNA glycosylase family protein [Serpentinicella sp. ANB-PHB4]
MENELTKDIKILFCETDLKEKLAPGNHYFSNNNNKFWSVLKSVGLTAERLEFSRLNELTNFGIKMVGLEKNDSNTYSTKELKEYINDCKPKVFCFNGKKTAKEFFNTQKIKYGLQNETIDHTSVFVVPSTASAADRFWNKDIWEELANFVQNSIPKNVPENENTKSTNEAQSSNNFYSAGLNLYKSYIRTLEGFYDYTRCFIPVKPSQKQIK